MESSALSLQGPKNQVSARDLWKSFDERPVVQGVSFDVPQGWILGLVGPNGAGKTTTIRMLLDILRPDRGEVTVFGQPITEATKEQIGYLPEERGLYQGQRVADTLTYLGELKGLSRRAAAANAQALLERLGMAPHGRKKVKELSRGMAQLIQVAAMLVHQPALVVLDEPFSALDPVNVRLLKEIIAEARARGAALVLSTHQMNQVEELCDRVVMIDQGRVVLSGDLADIKQRYRSNNVMVACSPWPEDLQGVSRVRREGDSRVMALDPGITPEEVLRQLLDRGASIDRFEVGTPSMEEIFVTVVRGRGA